MRPESTFVRCFTWCCKTTVDLDEDPAALCECGCVTCDRCHHVCPGAA